MDEERRVRWCALNRGCSTISVLPLGSRLVLVAQGTCTLCTDENNVANIQSFNNVAELESPGNPKPLEALFKTEERDTSRYILSGRRYGLAENQYQPRH